MSGCLRYSRRRVKAAFFLTNDLEVLDISGQYLSRRTGGRERIRRDQEPMDLSIESFTHFSASHVRNRMEGETVEKLVMVEKILSNTVDDKMQELVFLVKEQRHGQISDLLLRVFIRRDQIDGLEVPEIDIPTQNIDV